MEILAIVLLGAGFVISAIGTIWFLVVAFQESILWGVGCLIVPFVSLIFLIMHWRVAGKPFIVSVLGGMLIGAAAALAPETAASSSM